MTKTIDGIPYPETIDDVRSSPMFIKTIGEVLPKGTDMRNKFMFLVEQPTDGLKAYDTYIRAGGKREVRDLDGVTRALAAEAMQSAREDDHKTWPPILERMRNVFTRDFNENTLPDYYASDTFKAEHESAKLARVRLIMGDTREAAKRLGVHSAYHLEQLMFAINAKDKKGIASYARLIIQDNNLNVDAKTLVKALVNRQPLATADKPFDADEKVDVTSRKLQLCGFEKPKDQKTLEAARRFAEFIVLDDTPAIFKSHKKLISLEPATSLAATTPIKDMIKTFKRFKLVTA